MPFKKDMEVENVGMGDFNKMESATMDLDQLLKELNQPRQDFTPPESDTTAHEPNYFSNATRPEIPITPPISPEDALKHGRNAAKMLDTGIAFALKMFARDDSSKDYQASADELDSLAEPLSEISEKYNFRISPEIVLLFLVITIYMPKYFIASEKRQKAIEERQAQMEIRLRNMEHGNGKEE